MLQICAHRGDGHGALAVARAADDAAVALAPHHLAAVIVALARSVAPPELFGATAWTGARPGYGYGAVGHVESKRGGSGVNVRLIDGYYEAYMRANGRTAAGSGSGHPRGAKQSTAAAAAPAAAAQAAASAAGASSSSAAASPVRERPSEEVFKTVAIAYSHTRRGDMVLNVLKDMTQVGEGGCAGGEREGACAPCPPFPPPASTSKHLPLSHPPLLHA